MEHSFNVNLRLDFNGTHWVVYANKVALSPRIVDKKAAEVFFKCLKMAIPGIAEAISREMEK